MRKYTPHKPKMTPYKRESKAQRFREDSQLPPVTSPQVYNSKLLRYGGHSPKAC